MPHSTGSGKVCRCVSAERFSSASRRRTASSVHALPEPARSRPFALIVTRPVLPIPDSGARGGEAGAAARRRADAGREHGVPEERTQVLVVGGGLGGVAAALAAAEAG